MLLSDTGRLLIVDDDATLLKVYTAILKAKGMRHIVTESDSRRVFDHMNAGTIDVVVLDLYMPHIGGRELLAQIHERFPNVPVVIATSSSELSLAVECMKLGAFDFLPKPVENERLASILRKAFDWKLLSDQLHDLSEHISCDRLDNPGAFAEIVTRSQKMRSLFQYLEVVARSPQPVLITGESGTGKELVARVIHRLSGCSNKMISVNLAGLDDTMFADTLFGHKRGAFTGADQLRDGLVVKAAEGLLFLDEISDLSEQSQIKLLRLIQEREFYPVGADTPRRCDARIVCASNKEIKKLVAAGSFRNDLYYRLNVHHVSIPPLRERKEDIPLLLDHFIRLAANDLGIIPPSYPRELLELLATYNFPGNVRELEGMVTDAVARRQSRMISLEPFRRVITSERSRPPMPSMLAADHEDRGRILAEIWGHFPTLHEAEDFLIETALGIAQGNQGIAATMLGLKRQTLNMRLKVKKNRV